MAAFIRVYYEHIKFPNCKISLSLPLTLNCSLHPSLPPFLSPSLLHKIYNISHDSTRKLTTSKLFQHNSKAQYTECQVQQQRRKNCSYVTPPLTHSLLRSLTPSLPHSLPPSLPPSLTPSLPPSLTHSRSKVK